MQESRILHRPLRRGLFRALLLIAAGAGTMGGCISTYGSNAGGTLDLSQDALHQYLAKAELARPALVRDVMDHLRRGDRFRKRVRDQKNRWTLATVWVERGHQNVLHVVTSRNETCPVCGGTGSRKWNVDFMEKAPFNTRCLECKGKGYLERHTTERKYVISSGDFRNPEQGQRVIEEATQQHAPPQAQRYIDMIADKDPKVRIQALEWLDTHYVRKDLSFQNLLPMLKKAQWYEKSDEKRVMLWQFHAGKGLEEAKARAYYRIYADSHSGKVFRKGFYPEQ